MTGKELLEKLIEISDYMMNKGIGEIDTTCGKLRIKVVVDLINEDKDSD